MPEFSGQKDLRTYLRILWRWKLLFIFCLIAAPVAAYLLERGKPNIYSSSVLVGISDATVNTSLLNGANSFSTSNVIAIADLVTTTPVAREAASMMKPPTAPGAIAGEVSASGDPNTNFLTISAQDTSASRAAEIANAFAHAISLNRQGAAVGQINSAIQGLKSEIRNLGGGNSVTRSTLEQQVSQLNAARATQGSEATILQAATPSATPIGPNLRRTVELAALIGLLIGFGAVVLAENADRRLRTPDDLEGMTEVPMLATLAPTAFSDKLETRPADNEAFSMLRTALMCFNVDSPLRSVVITSAGEKEGKTTVATRLALNMARAGSRVVLVDADLRRAQVGARLGIEAVSGLGGVLAGEQSLADAVIKFPLAEPASGSLAVLPAGEAPENPAALLSSRAMTLLVRGLEHSYDFVIIDTPAALAVSDTLPLMRLVSGVVLVARMGRSSRESIHRLQRMINSAHGELLGVVAAGAAGHSPKYYYTTNGQPSRLRRGRKRARAPIASANGREPPDDAEVAAASAEEAIKVAVPDQREVEAAAAPEQREVEAAAVPDQREVEAAAALEVTGVKISPEPVEPAVKVPGRREKPDRASE